MKKRGRGVAACIYSATVPTAPNPCAAYVQMKEDGSVVIQTGATEIGQGSNTVLAQIAAEALGVPFEQVTVYSGDTGVTPYDFGTVSSRLTFTGGNAVLKAIEEVKQVLLESASLKLGIPADRLVISPGKIHDRDDPEKFVSTVEASILSHFVFRKLPIGKAYYYPANTQLNEDLQGDPVALYYYHATIAEVEVDTETGVVEVLKLYTAVDCGKAINPMLVEGQVQGGAMQAVGWALREDSYPYLTQVGGIPPEFNPDLRPDNFSDYAIATAKDVPEIHAYIIENPLPEGPFGAKAAGEIVAISGTPAIVNAIYDAVGVRIFDLPATPEKILKALKEKERAEMGVER